MGNESSQIGKKIENDIVLKWEKDDIKCPFAPREGQAAAVVGTKLFLFGGATLLEGQDDQGVVSESDELLVYNLKQKSWSKETCSGDCPGSRVGASLISVNNRLYIFGGLNQTSGWMNDFFVCDTDKKEWRKISAPNAPSPRDKVMSTSVGDKIYVFGGFGPTESDDDIAFPEDDKDDEYEDIDELQDVRDCQEAANFTWFDQLHMFDTVEEKWSVISSQQSKGPTPRAAHTLTYIRDNKGSDLLFVFGGRDMESRQKDLWKYVLSTNTWEECKGLGVSPQQRSFHAATAVGHRLVIFGGRAVNNQHFNDVHIFDTKTNQWFQPSVSDSCNEADIPQKMGLHSLCTVGDSVVLYGGSSNLDPATGTCTKFYNSVYTFPISNVLEGGPSQQYKSEENKENATTPTSVPGLLDLKSATAAQEKSDLI